MKRKKNRMYFWGLICGILGLTCPLSIPVSADTPELSPPAATATPNGTPAATPDGTPTVTPGSTPAAAPGSTPTAATASPAEKEESKKRVEQLKSSYKKRVISLNARRMQSSKIKLTWGNLDSTFTYKVFRKVKKGSKYGAAVCVATTKKNSVTVKKLNRKKTYQFSVQFFVNGDKIGETIPLVLKTGTGKFFSVKKVGAKRKEVTLSRKRSHTIRCRIFMANGKPVLRRPELYYCSADSKVAKVDGKGCITAVKKGKTEVYVMAPNGVYDTVKVNVK